MLAVKGKTMRVVQSLIGFKFDFIWKSIWFGVCVLLLPLQHERANM